MPPDPWQADLLCNDHDRILLNISRQVGKTQCSAAIALKTVLLNPDSLVLILSPSLRQSGEMFRDKVMRIYNALGRPVAATSATQLELILTNGSRIVSLPGEGDTVRGYSSVKLLVIDEAAKVSDSLYLTVRPMLAVSHGRLIALSTPFGRRGWFHKAWTEGGGEWKKVQSRAADCPRISKEFLEEERKELGDRWFRQEYENSFEDTVSSLFSYEDLQAACSEKVKPLILPE